MKKILVLLSLAAIALVSCQKEASVKDEASSAPVRTFKCVIADVDPDTHVAIASDGKTTWEVGDEILVHGEGSSNRITVTLTSDDISADGKTATITVEGVTPYDRSDKGYTSTFYASYPASAFVSGNTYYNSVLQNCNKPLMAGYNDGETMVFYNLCGIITFSVSGDFDNYVFSGNENEAVAYDVFQSRLAKTETGEVLDFLRSGDGYTPQPLTTVTGDVVNDGSTIHYICIPNGANFASGFTFKFKDGDDIVKEAVNKTAVDVARGKILNLGNITAKLHDYVAPTESDHESEIPTDGAVDLSENGTANCYVLTAPGTYKLPCVKGNSDTSVGYVWGVELLWETYNNSTAVTQNSVIAAVDFEDNWIYFQTPSTLKPGNALIAAKNYEGEIIWSWHIWIPETMFTTGTYGFVSAGSLMSRNLGALVDTQTGAPAAPESFGLLYQWARKDPFLGADAAGSTTQAACAGTAMTVFEGQMSQAFAAANPTKLGNPGSGLDWVNPSDRDAWGDQERSKSKSIYDPCPPGYRMAGRKHATIFTAAGSSIAGFSYDSTNYTLSLGDPASVFPICGYLNRDGSFTAGEAIVWNSHMDNDTPDVAYSMHIAAGDSAKKGRERYKACSVRCETD